MFKFLKPTKPGAAKKGASAPVDLKAVTALAQRSGPMVRPPPGASGSATARIPLDANGGESDGARPMTPERAVLIEQALQVHRSQQAVFADLDSEARHKLVLMAMLTLLKEARGGK